MVFFVPDEMLLSCLLIWLSTTLRVAESAGHGNSSFMVMDEDELLRGARYLGLQKKPRFMSFTTTDSDIVVDMQLSVPFLSIPIKKTMDSASGMVDKLHSANLNVGALGLTALILFGSAFILPKILNFFAASNFEFGEATPGKHSQHHHKHSGFQRTLDNGVRWTDLLEDEFTARGAPPRSCAGRIVCWTVQKSAEATERGQATSGDKIIDGLASNDWLLKMLQDSIVQEAIYHGYSKQDCSSKYPECKINENALENFLKAFSSKFFGT